MEVSNINTAKPMDNFHSMMPGYGNGTTPEPMYTPAFLQSLAPFSVIRFLNWDGSTIRRSPTGRIVSLPHEFVTDTSAGVPYEDIISLLTNHKRICGSISRSTPRLSICRASAELINTDLVPNVNVYVKYGNENWNYGFWQWGQVLRSPRSKHGGKELCESKPWRSPRRVPTRNCWPARLSTRCRGRERESARS